MFGLGKLTASVRSLADNLTALATTVAEVNHGVRARLALDGPEPPAEAPAGEVLENGATATPAALPTVRKGRKSV